MEVVGIASGIGVPFSRNSPHVVLSSIPRKIKERRSSKVVHRVLRRVHRDFTPLIVARVVRVLFRRGTRVTAGKTLSFRETVRSTMSK